MLYIKDIMYSSQLKKTLMCGNGKICTLKTLYSNSEKAEINIEQLPKNFAEVKLYFMVELQ